MSNTSPNVISQRMSYISFTKKGKIPVRQLQQRINLNRPLSRLSMDQKVKPKPY